MKHFKIPTEGGTYYCKIWLELWDGNSGQWLYVCRDVLTYIFLEVIDMVEHCGREVTYRWSASVATVDLLTTSPETFASAYQSCGGDDEQFDFKKEPDRLRIAQILYEYGSKSPLWDKGSKDFKEDYDGYDDSPDENHPDFRKLRAEARRWAEENIFDEESRNHFLDTKVVNKLGQTAREFAGGTESLWDTLRKIKEDPDATPEQKLVLKLYQGAGQTLGAGPVPEDIMEKK